MLESNIRNAAFILFWLIIKGTCAPGKNCVINNEFYFNLYPKGVSVREGSSAFLECNVSDSCSVRFHWTMDDAILSNTSRRYQNGSNFVISKVNRSLDSGEFKCVATIDANGLSKESLGATLSIQWIDNDVAVDLVKQSKGDNNEIKEIILMCNANGTEDLTSSTWYLNNRRLTKVHASKYSIDQEKRTLVIRKPEPSENGVYSCEAENLAGVERSKRNYLLSLPYAGLPKLVRRPADVLIKSGNDAFFDCAFDPQGNITWRRTNGDSLRTSIYGKFIILKNGSLLIKEATANEAGSYECGIHGKNGVYHGYAATLTIAYLNDFSPKNFVPPTVEYFVRRQQHIEIGCIPPEGDPSPKAYWAYANSKISSSNRMSVTDDLRLIINSVEETDQGEYRCVAENLAGLKFGSFHIRITSPPTITHHPASLEVNEDDFVQFNCKFSGDPYPITVVEWKKTGKLLKVSDKEKRIRIYTNNGTLTIDHVNPADDGHYDCVIRTKGQDPVVSKQATLKVKLKLKFAPKPVDKKLMFGSDARIPCVAVGHFTPTVRWFKRTDSRSSSGLNLKNSFPPNVREKNGILYFSPVKFDDAGYYTCTASSSQGYINETIRVHVYIFPKIVQGPDNATLFTGSEAYFHCVVTGEPKPKVEWYFEGKSESEKWPFKYIKFDNHTIAIRNLSLKHAGRFTCMAGNKAGFKRQEAILCIKAPNDHFAHCGAQVGLLANQDRRAVLSSDGLDPSTALNGRRQPADASGASVNADASSTAVVAAAVVGVYFAAVVALAACCGLRLRRRRRLKNANGANVNANANGNVDGAVNGNAADVVTFQRSRLGGQGKNIRLDVDNGEDRVLLSGAEAERRQGSSPGVDLNHCADFSAPFLSPAPCSPNNYELHSAAPCSSYAQAVQQGRGPPFEDTDDDGLATNAPSSSVTASSTISDVLRQKFDVRRCDLRLGSLLGTGQFGEVRLAKMLTRKGETVCGELTVFVKLCTAFNDDTSCYTLNRELEMYSRLQHPNIARLLAVCCESEPLLIAYEYLEYGNLKHYLLASQKYRANCSNAGAYPPPLSSNQVISIAHQVCKAMEYLAGQGFVHADLAARNILLAPDFTAKLCHLCLNKDAFLSDYCSYRNQDLPIRWMPPESISNDAFSEKSDVFAFGVFLLEMFIGGQTPYERLTDRQLIESILSGVWTPPTVPHFVQQRFNDLIQNCWRENAIERPTFAEIGRFFDQSILECDV